MCWLELSSMFEQGIEEVRRGRPDAVRKHRTSRARTRVRPGREVVEAIVEEREVPMEQEERREPLLSIQWFELSTTLRVVGTVGRSVNAPIDEVEVERFPALLLWQGELFVEHLQKARAYIAHGRATVRVVSLE
tara:strand:- start:384 stop:785 length:402 start_codon:yes stop_codon:yes gene_type:complete